MKFTVTYETVIPESAEHGDNSDTGYVMPGQWKYSTRDDSLDHASVNVGQKANAACGGHGLGS